MKRISHFEHMDYEEGKPYFTLLVFYSSFLEKKKSRQNKMWWLLETFELQLTLPLQLAFVLKSRIETFRNKFTKKKTLKKILKFV